MVKPPSTTSVWPVMKEASSDAKNATAPEISAPLPIRFSNEGGMSHVPFVLPEACAVASVAIHPGLTALTRIGAASAAKERVNASPLPLSRRKGPNCRASLRSKKY